MRDYTLSMRILLPGISFNNIRIRFQRFPFDNGTVWQFHVRTCNRNIIPCFVILSCLVFAKYKCRETNTSRAINVKTCRRLTDDCLARTSFQQWHNTVYCYIRGTVSVCVYTAASRSAGKRDTTQTESGVERRSTQNTFSSVGPNYLHTYPPN
jgi:hypothetical protein